MKTTTVVDDAVEAVSPQSAGTRITSQVEGLSASIDLFQENNSITSKWLGGTS